MIKMSPTDMCFTCSSLLFTALTAVSLGACPLFPQSFITLFLERPFLLNWHLNICWPVHYSSLIPPGRISLSRLLGSRVTSSRAVVWFWLKALGLAAPWKTITAHDSLATNWTVTPQCWEIWIRPVKTYMRTNTSCVSKLNFRKWKHVSVIDSTSLLQMGLDS